MMHHVYHIYQEQANNGEKRKVIKNKSWKNMVLALMVKLFITKKEERRERNGGLYP